MMICSSRKVIQLFLAIGNLLPGWTRPIISHGAKRLIKGTSFKYNALESSRWVSSSDGELQKVLHIYQESECAVTKVSLEIYIIISLPRLGFSKAAMEYIITGNSMLSN